MGSYAATSDVSARLPNRTIGASSKPSSTQVDQWITEVEALVNGYIEAAGASTPVTSPTRGVEILKMFVADRVAGKVERAYVSGTDLEAAGVGEDSKDALQEFLDLITTDAARALAMLGVGTSSGRPQLRAYVTDNADSKTITDGDFDPSVERDKTF